MKPPVFQSPPPPWHKQPGVDYRVLYLDDLVMDCSKGGIRQIFKEAQVEFEGLDS